ncbi:MAG: hypothetical protein MUD17_11600 [Gemmatimonadaceae bacterium]|jgi:hypothetical protein|nr:hypothetical protein [Gemmatimonadaceae bacterium]
MRSLRHRVAAVLSTALVAMRLLAPEAFSPCASWHGSAEHGVEHVHGAAATAPAAHSAAAHAAHAAHAERDAHAQHAAHALPVHEAPSDTDAPACPHCEGSDCCCVAPALDQRATATVPQATVDLARVQPHAAPDATLRTRVAFLLPFATAPPALS